MRIPERYVCDPPVADWARVVAANRERLAAMTFDVQDVPAVALRSRARRRVLELAEIDGATADGPLIVTGHQPQFYHPGIWVKSFTVTAEARRQGAIGLNLAVDHDAGELAAEIPWRDDGVLRYTKEFLVPPVGGRPLETLPPPGEDEVESFLHRLNERVKTLDWEDGMERLRLFAGTLRQAARQARNAAEVGYVTRARYEQAFGETLIPDVPVSRVSRTPEFLLFFVHWAVYADAMRTAYNEALTDYRARHRVHSKANPFPDLLMRPDGAVELPFWGLTPQGVRRKLYAQRTADGITLSHLEGVYAHVPVSGGERAARALMDAAVQIRPRAVPLTVFHRLFVADLFVHGTGGGRYDEVTDGFIERAFDVAAPTYAVVSGTLHLPLGELPVPDSALQALRHKLRDLQFNPQRYAWELAALDDTLVPLLRRKEELIDEIQRERQTADVARPSRKKVLTKEIEHVNATLYDALAPVVEQTRRELAALEVKERAGAVAGRRTYPFFLHAPADVWELMCAPCDDEGGQMTMAFPTGGR